ncbi:MAG: long-chain fatty acid--CoA ligase [Gemmatimonadota bacterium]
MNEPRTHASNPADLPEGTLVELFFGAVDRFGDRPALRSMATGTWEGVSFAEVGERVRRVAAALGASGLRRGDRAALLSPNRPEWAYADYGCLATGVIDIPIYVSLTAEQIGYILKNCGARLLFVADAELLGKVEEIRASCPALERIVVFDPPAELPDETMGWDEFLAVEERGAELPSEADFRAEARTARPSDAATILYTSGTTGDPKGVVLTHNNLFSNVQAGLRVIPTDESDSTLSFLPLSHVFQRMVDYLLFGSGASISYGRSIDTVGDDLKAVRPTVVVSVPRLYEKVYARITEASGIRGTLVAWATKVGARWADATLAGRRPGPRTSIQYALARRLVFSKVAAGVGGRLKHFVSGGAPLSPEINKFFFSAGILILEGYGLTETSPVTNVNSPLDFPKNFRIGTVGKPVPGTEIRIAQDGEILVRGPQVMQGYYENPEATREAMTEDGWFHTGDVGEIDADGFLRITDRKKDIIVTAGGKNVAPQPIENRLKKNRFVDQVVLLGDRRKFISLLLVPDFANLEDWAKTSGVKASNRSELLRDPGVQKLIETEVAKELEPVSRVERPKKIVLLEEPFTIEDGSLTPTQKVKRRVVEERHRAVVDSLYEEVNRDTNIFTVES